VELQGVTDTVKQAPRADLSNSREFKPAAGLLPDERTGRLWRGEREA
jgi:hypothetical protein